jgi:tetratricopeptide (TPR) repeat protein
MGVAMDDGVPLTVEELDRIAPGLLLAGRPARLLDCVDELSALPLAGHPWARLLVACVRWDADPGSAGAIAHAHGALRAFRRGGDDRGVGITCFVLGVWRLSRGDFAGADRWWRQAHDVVDAGDHDGMQMLLVHGCLGAYGQGRLDVARALAEEASALAQLLGEPRAEATALVNVGFMALWTGDFTHALVALDAAEAAFDEVPDLFDRYESPLCFGARGVLWALRGDDELAERDFTRGVLVAQEIREGWYEAIARILRAEFTAHRDPVRARQDAKHALAELQRRNENWWRFWAMQAAGVAAREAGMIAAAEAALGKVVAEAQTPLERARAQVALGETLLAAGQPDEAVPALRAAVAVLEPGGARYWTARCYLRLGQAEPANASRWLELAARGDISDPAFARLFTEAAELTLIAQGPGKVLRSGAVVEFRTHHACQALFVLALAPPEGIHVEQLAEAVWPDTSCDHRRLLGRVRTLMWQVREGLGPHAWRLRRDGPIVSLDLAGAILDLAETRDAARRMCPAERGTDRARELADRLRGPLLTRWAYHDWVLAEVERNKLLADQLDPQPAELGFDAR